MINVIEPAAPIICLFLSVMSFSFNKNEKLKSRKQIEQLFKEGKSITRFPLKLYYLGIDRDIESKIQVGISVPKKNFKKAVDRNRIKRLMREAYRLNKHLIFNNIEGNFAFLILYLGKEIPPYSLIEESLQEIIHRLVKEKK